MINEYCVNKCNLTDCIHHISHCEDESEEDFNVFGYLEGYSDCEKAICENSGEPYEPTLYWRKDSYTWRGK